jgi:hypothetical protein
MPNNTFWSFEHQDITLPGNYPVKQYHIPEECIPEMKL